MEIDQSNFNDWKTHPVTKILLDVIKEWDENLVEWLLNPDTILNKHIDCARMIGQRDIIERLINLTFDDLKIDKIEEDTNDFEEKI